jgi:hypothetical protein
MIFIMITAPWYRNCNFEQIAFNLYAYSNSYHADSYEDDDIEEEEDEDDDV